MHNDNEVFEIEQTIQSLPYLKTDPRFRAQLEQKVRMHNVQQKMQKKTFVWVKVVIVLAVLVLLFSVSIVLVHAAEPGSPLYSIKVWSKSFLGGSKQENNEIKPIPQQTATAGTFDASPQSSEDANPTATKESRKILPVSLPATATAVPVATILPAKLPVATIVPTVPIDLHAQQKSGNALSS